MENNTVLISQPPISRDLFRNNSLCSGSVYTFVTESIYSHEIKRNKSISDRSITILTQEQTDILQQISDVYSCGNTSQRNQAESVRNALSKMIDSDIARLLTENPIDAYEGEDGVFLIEICFKNLGLGFCLAPDPDNSGWYISSNKKAGNLLRSGSLESDEAINSAVEYLMGLLKQHIGELNS